MLDIALIRKSSRIGLRNRSAKLNDEALLARIDKHRGAWIMARRETRTRESKRRRRRETRLNRAMGKLRGNKTMPDEEKAARALSSRRSHRCCRV